MLLNKEDMKEMAVRIIIPAISAATAFVVEKTLIRLVKGETDD